MSINEPLFFPFDPFLPLRVDFDGDADFVWGTSGGASTFEAIVEDGDPAGLPDRFRIEVGGGEPVLIGEKSFYNVDPSDVVSIVNFDTIVFRGNVVVIGGATSFNIDGTSHSVNPGECIVATAVNLVVDYEVDGVPVHIEAGSGVFHMDGKGNDCSMSSLDGKGNDLRINGMEPIIINGGDTIVADGGYTVIRGANDSFDPTLGVDLFIRSNIIIKNPPIT